MNSKKKYFTRYISFAAAFGIMLMIFLMSAQDATQSNSTSGGFIRMIAPFLKGNYQQLSSTEQEAFVASLQFIVRKGAHFSVYTLLGVLLSIGMFTYERIRSAFKVIISFLICALYSLSDEIHQSFVPGRSCEFRDMLIDCSGALLGCLSVLAIYYLIKRRACRD